jgi:hypothetical protein
VKVFKLKLENMSCKKIEDYKVPGEDGLNSELFKYARELFHRRFLQFLNAIWYDGTLQESWQKDNMIAIKKRDTKFIKQLYRY